MSDPSNSSFIPKRGPASKRKGGSTSRRIYVFTLVSYILMFATLLATGGVYIYDGYIDRQEEKERIELNAEIASFSNAEMLKVLDFNSRLIQAAGRINNTVSLVSLLEALEKATVGTVKISSLDLSRVGDEKFELTTSILTDSFDSTIFQREVYRSNQAIQTVEFSDVKRNSPDSVSTGAAGAEEVTAGVTDVTFTAALEVPLSAVPYIPVQENNSQPITITDPEETELELTAEEDAMLQDNNEDNI